MLRRVLPLGVFAVVLGLRLADARQKKDGREVDAAIQRAAHVWQKYYVADVVEHGDFGSNVRDAPVVPTANAVSRAARRTATTKYRATMNYSRLDGVYVEGSGSFDTPARVARTTVTAYDPSCFKRKDVCIAGVRMNEAYTLPDAGPTYVHWPAFLAPERQAKTWIRFELAPSAFARIQAPGLVGVATAAGRWSAPRLLQALSGARDLVRLGSEKDDLYQVTIGPGGMPTGTTPRVNVWVGADGLVRKLAFLDTGVPWSNLKVSYYRFVADTHLALPAAGTIVDARTIGAGS
jgi:hypothetical protein